MTIICIVLHIKKKIVLHIQGYTAFINRAFIKCMTTSVTEKGTTTRKSKTNSLKQPLKKSYCRKKQKLMLQLEKFNND